MEKSGKIVKRACSFIRYLRVLRGRKPRRQTFHAAREFSFSEIGQLFERSEVRQSKSRKMEILSRHGKLPERFSFKE